MIKSLFLFCTKPWLYLSEIPPIILLILAISHNDASDAVGGLIPLILLMIFFIGFFFVFLFRAVIIRTDEIRKIGVFTDRDKVTVKKDMTLVLTLLRRGRIRIELFGTNDSTPVYPWLANSPTHELCMFRAKVNGKKRTAKKILLYYSVDSDYLDKIFSENDFECELPDVKINASNSEDGRKIEIRFLKTI